ncbi:hypothetical protein A2U01_0034775, partial [Trifolium medium]|nr:hypothetical protein [Trifolium medium]
MKPTTIHRLPSPTNDKPPAASRVLSDPKGM